jgi:hypothetical protein
MDVSRHHSGHFKHFAFTWRPAFTNRQTTVYPLENQPLVERQFQYLPEDAPPIPAGDHLLSTQEVIDNFVDYRCTDDLDRYLSRKLQVGRFLLPAQINSLRGEPEESVSKPMALLDDRNNENVTRLLLNGRCRPSNGPLSAHGLFTELSRNVSPLYLQGDQIPNLNCSDYLDLQTLQASLLQNDV